MKNIINKWFIPALLSTFVLASCDKYLDIQPKGMQLLITVEDYNQWLNSYDLEYSELDLNLLADNVDNPIIQTPFTSTEDRMYTWQEQFSEDVTATPKFWRDIYNRIYYFNTVIKEIDDAEGTEVGKKSLKAEALLGRAFEYLYLVNLYGKQYDTATADEDLAVPFVISNDLTDPTPDLSTVQDIYDHIIEDLSTAVSDLPEDNSENRFRGSVAAAYSALARTYLYMGDYTKATQNAQLALSSGSNTILDYSTMADADNISDLQSRLDAIYARWVTNYSETPTLEFLQSFDTTDLRLKFFYSKKSYSFDLGDYSFTTRGEVKYYPSGVLGVVAYSNWGTTVVEMHLIIAEAAARANDLTTACDQLDLVRKCRFRAETYEKFESTNQEEVLQKILNERTFEFAFTGLRWFDMRRLDAEGRMADVNRYDGSGNVIATLPPGSAKYTLHVPVQVLNFNPDWTQNSSDE
jgi:tetratricopeptide (TPR) repeat protein